MKLAPAAEAGVEVAGLYGGFEDLIQSAARGVRVQRAVFPLRSAGDPFLSRAERDALWERFEVPIYCLVLDADGRVIGYECEAQSGVHVADGYRGVLAGRIESAACECGRPGLRLADGSIQEKVERLAEALLAG